MCTKADAGREDVSSRLLFIWQFAATFE